MKVTWLTTFLLAWSTFVSGQLSGCNSGTYSSVPRTAVTHLCDIAERRGMEQVTIYSHQNAQGGATITQAQCGAPASIGCEVTVAANVEVNFQSLYFSRESGGRDQRQLAVECQARIEIVDYDVTSTAYKICDTSVEPVKFPCQSREKTYFITYVSSDPSIQSIFNVQVFASHYNSISVRCNRGFLASPQTSPGGLSPTAPPTNSSNTGTMETVLIVIGVVVLLVVLVCFVYCCYWLRRAEDEGLKEPDNKPPVGSKLMARLANTFSRGTTPKVIPNTDAVPAGQGIPVTIAMGYNEGVVNPGVVRDEGGEGHARKSPVYHVTGGSAALMGTGDVDINPMLHRREILKPSVDKHDPLRPPVMYSSHGDVGPDAEGYLNQPGTSMMNGGLVPPITDLRLPPSNVEVLTQSDGALHPGQPVMTFGPDGPSQQRPRPSTLMHHQEAGAVVDPEGGEMTVEPVSSRPRRSILKTQMLAEMVERNYKAGPEEPQYQPSAPCAPTGARHIAPVPSESYIQGGVGTGVAPLPAAPTPLFVPTPLSAPAGLPQPAYLPASVPAPNQKEGPQHPHYTVGVPTQSYPAHSSQPYLATHRQVSTTGPGMSPSLASSGYIIHGNTSSALAKLPPSNETSHPAMRPDVIPHNIFI